MFFFLFSLTSKKTKFENFKLQGHVYASVLLKVEKKKKNFNQIYTFKMSSGKNKGVYKVSSNQMLSKVNAYTDAMEIPHFLLGVASVISY